MANQLAMDQVQAIKSFEAAGLSERKVAEARRSRSATWECVSAPRHLAEPPPRAAAKVYRIGAKTEVKK